MAQMFEMADFVRQDERRITCYLPLKEHDAIIVLDQVRKTKPSTEEKQAMQQSFLHNGQLTPGTVAVLTRGQAIKYLKQVGVLWGRDYDISDYRPILWNGKTYYMFLIAGHMRLETARSIAKMSTPGLPKSAGKFVQSYYAELRFGLTAEEAIRIQINENVRMPLHPMDEMFAAQMVWKWKKNQKKRFTQADLARMFGRSSSWVASSMLMAELPEKVQRMAIEPGDNDAHKAAVPRGYLVTVARLATFRAKRKKPMSEEEIAREVVRVCFEKKLTPAEYDKQVTDRIAHESGDTGQTTMELLGGADGRVSYKNPVRQIIGEGLAQGTIGLVQNLEIVLRMFEEEMLGDMSDADTQPISAEVDPAFLEKYSVGSPINNMGKLADVWVRLAPLMARVAQAEGGRGRARIERALEEAGVSKAVLDELAEKEQSIKNSSVSQPHAAE